MAATDLIKNIYQAFMFCICSEKMFHHFLLAFNKMVLKYRLKHSQYKNDATRLKNFLDLKLPPFFLQRVGDGKMRKFQNQEVFQLNCVFLILTAL